MKGFERRLSHSRFGTSDRQAIDRRDCRPLKERSSLVILPMCNGRVKLLRSLDATDSVVSEWKFAVIEIIYREFHELEAE